MRSISVRAALSKRFEIAVDASVPLVASVACAIGGIE